MRKVVAAVAGDAALVPGELGTDIVGGTITSDPAKPTDLTFGLKLASLPAGGIGESIIYGWELLVDGAVPGGGDSGNLEWRRSNVTGLSLSAAPYIRFRSCAPDPNGQNTCTAGSQLPGAMDATTATLTATMKLGALSAQGGSLVGSSGISVYHGTGLLWFPGIASDDAAQDVDYVVPSRADSVQLALVPAGAPAPASFPVKVTPAGKTATGAYSASLPTDGLAPGAYDVVARACWGSNCGETRTPVTLS